MKSFITHLLLIFLLSAPAAAEPWAAHNQTAAPTQVEILNPPTKMAGERGEVSFPYTVPVGKNLIIRKVILEPLFGAAMILWVGTNPTAFDMNGSLQTFASGGIYNFNEVPLTLPNGTMKSGTELNNAYAVNAEIAKAKNTLLPTKEWEPNIVIASGKTVNMRLWANWNPSVGWIYGWAIRGELVDQ